MDEVDALTNMHPNYPAPPHVFALRLDDELALRLRERHDAAELYLRVAADRPHLGRWFRWAREADRLSIQRQVERGLDQFVAGAGWHADLCWRGESVGALWLHNLDKDGGSTEVGYWLASAHEGKGLVTRALRGLLRHFFEERRLGRVAIALDPRNERSLAIVQRLGLEPEAVLRRAVVDADGAPGDLAFYGLLREQWEARSGAAAADPTAPADAAPAAGATVPAASAPSRGAPPRFALCLDREAGLYLAVFEREDAAELAELVTANDAHLRPWMPWVDGARPASQLAFIENRALPGLAAADGFECAITVGGRIVGAAGVHDVNAISRRGSIGYWLDRASQGRGYVTTTVRAIVERCFTLGIFDGEPFERLDILAEVDNVRSRAVPERLGFAFEGVLRRHRHNGTRYADFAVYSLLRSEYLQPRSQAEAELGAEPAAAVTVDQGAGQPRRAARPDSDERALDDALDDSFPASDPPSHEPRRSADALEVEEREDALDDALDDSFPASDPPSQTAPQGEEG